MKILFLFVLLLFISCSSTHMIQRSAFTNDTTPEAIADYMEMIELSDSCWVLDSTYLEVEIKCKKRLKRK